MAFIANLSISAETLGLVLVSVTIFWSAFSLFLINKIIKLKEEVGRLKRKLI